MWDFLEPFLNVFGGIILGAVFVEYGLCRLQKRKFSRKSYWTVLMLALGAQMILSHHHIHHH